MQVDLLTLLSMKQKGSMKYVLYLIIIFSKSLKANTRAQRNQGISVRYKVNDETKIEHLTTKQFLSDIETKNELNYLPQQKTGFSN